MSPLLQSVTTAYVNTSELDLASTDSSSSTAVQSSLGYKTLPGPWVNDLSHTELHAAMAHAAILLSVPELVQA